MLILGNNSDDVGTQLERLTRDILEQQGYTNVITNRIGLGGEEIDVSADFPMPVPGGVRTLRTVVECKAYRDPVDTTAWLKFLGKVFIEEATRGEEANGLFVALSGVNGNVAGSYDGLRHVRDRIRLLSGDELAQIVCDLHGAATAKDVVLRLGQLSPRKHTQVELVYHARRVYWLIGFGNNEYTLLSSTAEKIPNEQLDILRPLMVQRTQYTAYIDLDAEAQARARSMQIRQNLLVTLISSTREMRVAELAQVEPLSSEEEITRELQSLVSAGWLIQSNEGFSLVSRGAPNFYRVFTDVLSFVFQGYITTTTIETVMTSEYVRGALTQEFIDYVTIVQRSLPVPAPEAESLLQIVRVSPAALLYCATPDPMIVNHRDAMTGSPQFDDFDLQILMRRAFERFVADFETQALGDYFHRVCGIREIETFRRITVKGAHGILVEREISNRVGLGPLADQHGGGYIHILMSPQAPPPWEFGEPTQVDVSPPTSPST